MASGEVIGKRGKPVKTLQSQLSGLNIDNLIESIENDNYQNFVRYVLNQYKTRSYWGNNYKFSSASTLISKLPKYSDIEQLFAMGINNINKIKGLRSKDIPKGFLKAASKKGVEVSYENVIKYQKDPNLFVLICNQDYETLNINKLIDSERNYNALFENINTYNCKATTLLKYYDYLVSHEGIKSYDVAREHRDYLKMSSDMSNRFDKYPKYFLSVHRIISKNYTIFKDNYNVELFQKNIKKEMEYANGKYIIVYPETPDDIKDEATQQSHCVASYIDRVIDGKTNILFMRKRDFPEKSLITLEVKNNKIIQKKGKLNRGLSKEEMMFVSKYQEKVLNKLGKGVA